MIIDKPLRSLLWLLALVGATEPAGAVDIIGRVDISRPIATRATPIATRATPTATRNPATASLDTLAARIFLRGPEMVTTRRSGPITIRRDIRNGVLVPSFEIIRLGDRLAITNRDAVPRRAFVFEHDRTWLLGPLAPSATASLTLRHFGVVELSTDAPDAVRSLLFVAENPFVAIAEPDGRFRMGGVPPGDYRLIAWRPEGYLGECPVPLSYDDSVMTVGTIRR